ncbi:alpha-1,3-mannosyl-glycoprotein 4-beta-N-acetylglucosaminyltransferase B-like [Clupea harengus]|uniref:Alpha-1,3-mannosyl-glycoprotein 4-beta-N-acetylglucosaminyltransferase B-like n=1 Tax=Clupea harengus TaxID=7950 RepID=A0A6P8GVW2_CLUHA|nr:alpha-1,3-mannosyl-glycoprotein 4-beta-N-acetylglucosaminyltransferase B-like [Clupea harengus]
MRHNYGTLLIVFSMGCLFVISWHSAQKDYTSKQVDLASLFERLQQAEQRATELTTELNFVLKHLDNVTQTTNTSSSHAQGVDKKEDVNASISMSYQTSSLFYLPHLRHHKDSLVANAYLGKGRSGVSLVLGIPTVHRQKQSYLVNTIASLLYDLSPQQKDDMVIIIFVAETDPAFVTSVAEDVRMNFPADVSAGLVEVISPPASFYPDFSELKSTFGDSKDRVKWRTKQNLDFSFLMMYAQPKGTFYVQLEDDIVAKLGYSDMMKTFATGVSSEEWLYLEFSQLGFIGKLFRTSDLPMVVEFFLMFHKDKPIDWLLDHILWVKVCNPEKDAKHCNAEKSRMKRRHKPSLFQHVGLHSSLPGKIQNLKDKDFGKQPLFTPHKNPGAELSSSLKHYQTHSLDKAYRGQDFFWGLTPTAGDYIHILFQQPQRVQGYLFRSGNIETNGDRFYNTTVEVLPRDRSVVERVQKGELPQYQASSDGFIVIGSFVNGLAEGVLDAAVQELTALRLLVHTDSDVWVLLSEMFIKV